MLFPMQTFAQDLYHDLLLKMRMPTNQGMLSYQEPSVTLDRFPFEALAGIFPGVHFIRHPSKPIFKAVVNSPELAAQLLKLQDHHRRGLSNVKLQVTASNLVCRTAISFSPPIELHHRLKNGSPTLIVAGKLHLMDETGFLTGPRNFVYKEGELARIKSSMVRTLRSIATYTFSRYPLSPRFLVHLNLPIEAAAAEVAIAELSHQRSQRAATRRAAKEAESSGSEADWSDAETSTFVS